MPEERLLALFDRLRRIALAHNPLEDRSVTGPQLTLLQWATASPGCGIQEIADGLGLTAPTVSVAVRRLEDAGMLERHPDPADGRAVRLFLTDQGQAMQQRAQIFRLNKMRRLLASLVPEEGEQMPSLLERAINAAEKP